MSYLILLKLRDISRKRPKFEIICKGKKYLKPGQKPPVEVKLHKGPRGGTYYLTEELHVARGTTPKKRLPAFRKQEDGSVLHRTKEGQHGPGAYKIRTEGKEHQLSFLKPSGEELHLGKHININELKMLVNTFKNQSINIQSNISTLKKRVEWNENNQLKESVKSNSHFKVQHGKKMIPETKINVGGMQIKAIPYTEDGELGYSLWQEYDDGGSSTLIGNDLGKFFRYRAIAETQKVEKSIKRIDNQIKKIKDDLNNSITYCENRHKIKQLSIMIERDLKNLENETDPDRATFTKEILNSRNLELAKLTDAMMVEGSDYTDANLKIKKLKEKKEKLKKEISDKIRKKIFEFLPDSQRIPIHMDQKEWASSNDKMATKEQVDNFVKVIRPYMPKGTKKLGLTLIIDPDNPERSNHMAGANNEESYIHLNNGDHLFNRVLIHEVGHALEYQYNNISDNCARFYKYRTEGGEDRPLKEVNSSYEEDEVYIPDEFTDPYCGKNYHAYGHSELMSMGLQKLFQDPGKFAMEDGEYFDMVITSLYGYFWREDGYHS